jgi:predicted CoA-binding protein
LIDARQILAVVRAVLLVDYPSRDVPDSLVRAGFGVVVQGGPGPQDYRAQELKDGEVVAAAAGPVPDHVDLVYAYRPVGELAGIVTLALSIGARFVWIQSGVNGDGSPESTGCWMPESESEAAREIVEATGLSYLDHPYIGAVVRRLDDDGNAL